MSHIFPRHTRQWPPEVARAEGMYFTDRNGKQYLDGCGGAAVSCLGHGNRTIIDAVHRQLDEVAWAHTGFFTSAPAEKLADELIRLAPHGIERVYIHSGGSEAVEAALKIARQFHLERAEPEREFIIARLQSYHGNTLGALSAGGNLWRREPYAPLLSPAMHHVDACYAYRGQASGESEEAYAQRLADQLEAKILQLGSERVAAFIAEPVVGATLGAVPAVSGYFSRVRDVCDRYGVLLILDEVMCGIGRTGTFFAVEQEGISPDIITVAKGLGGGVQPISAMLCSATIYDTIASGSGFFQHGHTWLGHPSACAAGVAVIEELERGHWLDAVQRQGAALHERLQSAFGNHPHVGDIRGRGLFQGIELVEDRDSKVPFDPSRAIHARIKSGAFERGLMVYPMGGTLDGKRGDHVLLAPPYIINNDQLDELVDKLAAAVDWAING